MSSLEFSIIDMLPLLLTAVDMLRRYFERTGCHAGEERHKSLLFVLLNVYITRSELLALPVTPSEGPPQGVSMSVEAHRVEARSLRLYSWSFNTIGVFWQCTPQTITQPIIQFRPMNFRQCPDWLSWVVLVCV
eukprot:COSAG02_NODE_205_length_29157_cov_13.424771_25_plen_133_part_00